MMDLPLIRRAALCAAIAMPAALYAQEPGKPAAAAKRPTVSRVKDAPVEVKCGEEWKKALVRNTRGAWTLVAYDSGVTLEWVEPWRLRMPGADYDIAAATANPPAVLDKDGVLSAPPRVSPGPPPMDRVDDFAPLPIDWPVTAVDATKVPEASLATTAWTYALAAPAPTKLRDAPLSLQGGMQTDGSDAAIAFDASGNVALVGYQSKSNPKVPVAETIDLATGKPIARAELNPATRPLATSPDGRWLLCRAEGAYVGTMTRLDVWDVEGKSAPKHVVSFEPFAKEAAKDVDRAFAIDADRVLTVNRDGALVAWKIAAGSATPIWRARLADGDVALSPDRRVIAGLTKTSLAMIKVDDGKPAGAIETSVRSVDALSFRGDGKRLAALVGPTIYEFDLESGRQTASIGLPPTVAATDVRHLAGDLVLAVGAPKATAVDVGRAAFAAQYVMTGVDLTAVAGDRLAGLTRRGAQRLLSSWTLAPTGGATPPTVPNAGATRASIDVQLDVDEYAKQAIVDSMRKQVTARGWTLVGAGEPASVRIVAKTEEGTQEQRPFVSSIGKHEVANVQPRLSRLTVEVEGRVAWTTAAPGPQVPVPAGPAEQMQKAIAEGARRTNVAFLKNVALPQTIFMPMETLPPSVSQQTLPGARGST